MIQELDLVVLKRGIRRYGLRAGDVGAVAHCYPNQAAFEVEFVTAQGKTIALLTLTAAEIRPFWQSDILHARTMLNDLVRERKAAVLENVKLTQRSYK